MRRLRFWEGEPWWPKTSFWGFLWGIRVLGEARFVKETLSGAAVKSWSIAGEGGHEGLAEMAHVLKRGGEVTPRIAQRHSSGQDAFFACTGVLLLVLYSRFQNTFSYTDTQPHPSTNIVREGFFFVVLPVWFAEKAMSDGLHEAQCVFGWFAKRCDGCRQRSKISLRKSSGKVECKRKAARWLSGG